MTQVLFLLPELLITLSLPSSSYLDMLSEKPGS